jgi:signal peptidase I
MVVDSAIHLTKAEPSEIQKTDAALLSEQASPGDWVSEDRIKVYKDKVVIDFSGRDIEWSAFTDTNSMDPLLDSSANGIEVVPKSADEIQVGDVVAYKSEYADGIIIHRVIEKGYDRNGAYFTIKGDNLKTPDPGKVRFEQIQRVLVAVIY